MKNVIIRTLKEIRLRGRFAARKLGLSGWQVHQICLPDQKLIYIPIPKNSCTTIKQAFHQIEFGRVFDTKRVENDSYVDVHDYYQKRADAFTSTDNLFSASNHIRFAIVRDPVERLISCYRNRILDLNDLKSASVALKRMNLSAEPDLNTFVLNLDKYRKASKSLEHHSRLQAAFLGGTLKYLDHVYRFEQVDELHELLRTRAPYLKILNRKSGGSEVNLSQLSNEALAAANRFYRKDYQLLKKFYSPIENGM